MYIHTGNARDIQMVCVCAAGYGQESHSRVQRQQIPHQIYKDSNGVEHVRVSGTALPGVLLTTLPPAWTP